MALTLAEIKMLESVDLSSYEIRGAKYGINNARSTGSVYVSGQYIPSSNELQTYGVFTASDSTVRGIGFYPPDSSFNASQFLAGDTIQFDGTAFSVAGVVDTTSISLTEAPTFSATKDFTSVWGYREYLVEPDVEKNTVTGNATFTQNDTTVIGIGTFWTSQLVSGDFFKADSYQKNYIVSSVPSDTQVVLTNPYEGISGTEGYTAKHRQLGRMYVEYIKDDFHYEKNGGVWEKNDGTTGSIIATEYPSLLADGINIKFSKALSASNPDLMDSAQVLGQVFAQKTQNEMPQFPLPVVPYPESSLTLYINDIEQDRFPDGNKDYVVSYHQDPNYLPPPAPADRRVANLMFLNSTGVQTLAVADTALGSASLVNEAGDSYSGIMPGSENIWFDGTAQTAHEDYAFDSDAGIVFASQSSISEKLVGPIFVDYSELIDYGILFTLDGRRLEYSVPPRSTDEVMLSLESGRFKPSDKDHPGAGEEYIINYLVDSEYVNKEFIPTTTGTTSFRTKQFPIKTDSVILSKNGIVLDEVEDYRISYQTGRVVLFEALVATDQIVINYAPLASRRNGINYSDGVSYCTSYNARLVINSATNYSFSLQNSNLKPSDATFLKVFNVNRSRDYNLDGIATDDNTLVLAKDSTNLAIGLADTDIVTSAYKFASEETEYSPIVINNYVIYEDTTGFQLPMMDATALFPAGSIVRLTPSDVAQNYYYVITSSCYDGEDTDISFDTTVPEDIVNPYILVTDSDVNFFAVGDCTNVTSGSNIVSLPSVNIPNQFREGSLLRLGAEIYEVSGAVYENGATRVTLSSGVFKDYTSATLYLSETPVYPEGATTIIPATPAITEPAQPLMLLNYWAGTAAYVTTDNDGLSVLTDSSTFFYDYDNQPTVGDMSSGMSVIPGLSTHVYEPLWQSSKLTQVQESFIGADSSTLMTGKPALRIDGTDSTAFSIIDGEIILNEGLVQGQKMYLDYQGTRYLGDMTVSFLADYFVNLPSNSKVSASFQFSNLDQFYIQVVTQRWFLENVTEPRAKEEASQQSGSVGQGGEVPNDADQGNSSGGLTNDEFRRQDTEIECRVFTSIFDYFNNRLGAMAAEMQAGIGWSICNNDGLLSKSDQSSATKSFNRMWPDSDYTNMEPKHIPPISGTVYAPGTATFTNGSPGVTGINTKWALQAKNGDYLRTFDSTRQYQITVNSDTSVSLQSAFQEATQSNTTFALSSNYPLFDDDGNMGAKIVGTISEPFSVAATSNFICLIDGVSTEYIFASPAYTGVDIAGQLTTNIEGLNARYESIFDPATTYGSRSVLVLRTDGTFNCIEIGAGSANTMLGFTTGAVKCGNLNAEIPTAEAWINSSEIQLLANEKGHLDSVIAIGATFKLDRTTSPSIIQTYAARAEIVPEYNANGQEQDQLNVQIASLNTILEEPSLPSYSSAVTALANANTAVSDTSSAQTYNNSILTDWEGKTDASKWVLDFSPDIQYVYGVDSTGVAVDHTGTGITPITGLTNFILQVPPGYDVRYMNLLPDQTVSAKYLNHSAVPGFWSGWQAPPPVWSLYSQNNQITFTGGPFTGPLYVTYQTISDRILADRTDYCASRTVELNMRKSYLLNTREDEIFNNVKSENFLNTDGDAGDLYIWANNRFNRRQGCDARLMQQEKLIEANQSGLGVNKTLI